MAFLPSFLSIFGTSDQGSGAVTGRFLFSQGLARKDGKRRAVDESFKSLNTSADDRPFSRAIQASQSTLVKSAAQITLARGGMTCGTWRRVTQPLLGQVSLKRREREMQGGLNGLRHGSSMHNYAKGCTIESW